MHGVLQQVPLDEGQRVTAGTNLARVGDPTVLKAELRIAETQAKDIQVGQKASIDTRNGVIPGTRRPHRPRRGERHGAGRRGTRRRAAAGSAA